MVLFQFLWQQILQAEELMSMASRTSSTTIYRTNLKVTFTVLEERLVQDAAVLHTPFCDDSESGYLVGIQQLIGKEIPVESSHPFHFIGAIPKPGQKPGKIKEKSGTKKRPRNQKSNSNRGRQNNNSRQNNNRSSGGEQSSRPRRNNRSRNDRGNKNHRSERD